MWRSENSMIKSSYIKIGPTDETIDYVFGDSLACSGSGSVERAADRLDSSLKEDKHRDSCQLATNHKAQNGKTRKKGRHN